MNQKNFWKYCIKSKKVACVLASLTLILIACIGGTVAYLITQTGTVVNTFKAADIPPAVVEDFDNSVKSNVKIQNTGSADAYIRASVIFTWVDSEGNVYGEEPKEWSSNTNSGDYTITWCGLAENGGWILGTDGYYYYKNKVGPSELTTVLFTDCKLVEGISIPEGYNFSVEILSQSIQSNPDQAIIDSWGDYAASLLKINVIGTD